jgi:hypothetical protein
LQNWSDHFSLHNSLHWCQVFSKRNVAHNLHYNSLSSHLMLSLIYTLDSMQPLQSSAAKTPYIFWIHARSMFCPSKLTWLYYLMMFGDDCRHNLGGRGKRTNAALIFVLPLPKNSFSQSRMMHLGWERGKGLIYIKDRFKPIFPVFLTWILRKLNFIIYLVESLPPPPPHCY